MARGATVKVTLDGTEANVRLLDSSNFQRYRTGGQHQYFGGHYKRSPALITVPRTDHWHVIDLGGYQGTVRTGCEVIP